MLVLNCPYESAAFHSELIGKMIYSFEEFQTKSGLLRSIYFVEVLLLLDELNGNYCQID